MNSVKRLNQPATASPKENYAVKAKRFDSENL